MHSRIPVSVTRSSPYLAYVSWLDQDQQHALVELGNRGEVRGSFEFRRLKFTKQDLPAERSEAIGLTVASLAGSTTPPEPAASAPEIPVQVSEPSNPLRWRLEVTARIASGFRGAGAAPGGALRLAYNLPGLVLFPVGFAGWRTASEAGITGKQQALKGASFVITGDVTEFGRKVVGDQQLFGILGRGMTQVAYAKVALNVVNVHTSEVSYSVQGAGEYELSNREVVGFGGTAGYDATLNGKVLDLAIREAVNNLVSGMESGAWRPAQ